MSLQDNKEEGKKEDNAGKLKEFIIIGTIRIEKNELKERIINSYENVKREEPTKWNLDTIINVENEDDITDCEIFINEKNIKFNYYYNFPSEGIYTIKYKFKKVIRFTTFMFYNCKALISLDLSNFNTQNITDMNFMFSNCYSLISLDLSNFNTQNVIYMDYMFYECNSLQSLDLSNFNTQNVINMNHMFYNCNTIKSLYLSKFNTQNVINMNHMFYNCKSLKSLDL